MKSKRYKSWGTIKRKDQAGQDISRYKMVEVGIHSESPFEVSSRVSIP
jgi:hypothetical protein